MIKPTRSESNRPKKRWGQNFLIDPNISRKILDCAEIQMGEPIIEIGPGRGILTLELLAHGAKVTAIEIDRDLIQTIREGAKTFDKSEIRKRDLCLIQGNALAYAYQNLPAPYKVVANLPYNISSPILFRLLQEKTRISRMVLMLQKELAERIVAAVGKKSYGALSIIVQYYADVKILFTVSPTCFWPRPKVASAVVLLLPLPTPRIKVQDEDLFINIVKGAFQHRRKQLTNALICEGFDAATIRTSLQKMKIDLSRRGETFTIFDFAALADTMIDCMKHL